MATINLTSKRIYSRSDPFSIVEIYSHRLTLTRHTLKSKTLGHSSFRYIAFRSVVPVYCTTGASAVRCLKYIQRPKVYTTTIPIWTWFYTDDDTSVFCASFAFLGVMEKDAHSNVDGFARRVIGDVARAGT